MTKEYKFQLDKIEVRSSTKDKKKEYIVKAYASHADMVDLYKFQKTPTGYKSFKSLFTDNCLNSMNRQAKSKKVFFDFEHEVASKVNIRGILNKINQETGQRYGNETEQIMSYLRTSEIAPAKPFNITVDDKSLIVEARINPNHEKFDYYWKNIEDKFVNGMSINFKPTKISEKFVEGEWIDVIDDVDLYGFSFTGGAALPENNIFEVAVRSLVETKNEKKEKKISTRSTEDGKMEKEVKELQDELKQFKADKAKAEKDEQEKMTLDKDKAFTEKITTLEKQLEEQSKSKETMETELKEQKEKLEKLNKTGQRPYSQSVVLPQDKYKLSGDRNEQHKAFTDKLDKVGLGELLKLSDEVNAESVRDPETLFEARKRQPTDMIAKKE